MKKIILVILLSLSSNSLIFAGTEKELFDNGVLYFKQGHYQQAVDTFSKLIELAPGNADAYKNRGVSRMKQEKFDLAIEDFEKAKELFPELRGLYSNLGVAWYFKKEYEKAIENYDIDIEMVPDNHVAYFNRALCLAELDRNKEALDDLSQALKLKPAFYWAMCYKADLLAHEGEDIKAIETYEAAIKQDPLNSYAIDKLVQLKQKIKEKESLELTQDEPEVKLEVKAEVKLEVKSQLNEGYALQTGAFLNQENAITMKTRLINNGLDSRILTLKGVKGRTWYLVRLGNYPDKTAAQKSRLSLKEELGIKSVIRPFGSW